MNSNQKKKIFLNIPNYLAEYLKLVFTSLVFTATDHDYGIKVNAKLNYYETFAICIITADAKSTPSYLLGL